jgi:hypothetical protein
VMINKTVSPKEFAFIGLKSNNFFQQFCANRSWGPLTV